MSTVTRISIIEKPQAKMNVYLDGALTYALPLDMEKELSVGQILTEEDQIRLERMSQYFKCLASGKRLVTNRPHSRKELKTKLLQRHYPSEAVDKVLDKLTEWGLVNDEEFAAYWIDNRNSCNPKSKLLTAAELRDKGVSSAIISAQVKNIDDSKNAYEIASRRAERLAGLDKNTFMRRLGSFLERRGFSYETIRPTVEKLWVEYKTN